MKKASELRRLYKKASKHSQYQIMPECLADYISTSDIIIRTRHEKERLNYILSKIDPRGKTFLDIGGNTGYFTLELVANGASFVEYFDGNTAHADFVKYAASILSFQDKIEVFNSYFDFDEELISTYHDVSLLLNVLHHIGDDYGNKKITLKEAKGNMINSVNKLSFNTETLILQFGFCWQGNIKKLLFEKGTKSEMIDFVKKGTKNYWRIDEIGIAELGNNQIVYKPVNEFNIKRNDEIGEFLNRPIFILKSLMNEQSGQ